MLELLDVGAAAATHLSVPRCESSIPSRHSDVDRVAKALELSETRYYSTTDQYADEARAHFRG